MIIVDTSAWTEFIRDTGSKVCTAVDDLQAARPSSREVPRHPSGEP
jgi:hypothetical protein